jgi:hypothetical protein
VKEQHNFLLAIITSLSSCFAKSVICLMINLGASSDSLMMNDETDLGPLVSLELNSLFPSSLNNVSARQDRTVDGITSKFHRRAAGSRIVLPEYAGTRP